jgi:hypothetical protein
MFTCGFSGETFAGITLQLANAYVVTFVPIENGKSYSNIYPTD